ncbi:MAG: hypothetical protein CMP41_00005 [Rickettsiales bacterium]|nr:hypothetical protein [Rickettsiales bacterium]
MVKQFFLISAMLVLALNNSNSYADGHAKGKKVFKKCAACHNVAEGAKHKTGPNLWGIVGSKAGAQEGYKYSKWLASSNIVWDEESLAKWVSPKKVKAKHFGKDIKKSKMIFSGLRKDDQITDLIKYLKTLK